MDTECAPKRETEVTQQMSQLEKTIEETCAVVNSLRSRITPVLKQQPTEKIETGKDPDNLVPLATSIRQCRNKLSGCNSDIRELIETCEL